MFIRAIDKKTATKLKSFGAKEIKQNNSDLFIFLYDEDVLYRYNKKYNNKNIFLTDKIYFA